MIDRIASFHSYQSTTNDMMRQQVKVQDDQEQLASGKRVLTSGDDPNATIYIQNFNQENTQIDQYLNAISLARNRQTREEIAISEAENMTDDAKRQVMEMINGALSREGRAAHQQDLIGIFNNFMNLVNQRDESGNFLFSGTKSSTQPFHRDTMRNVTYAGDSYFRLAQVGADVDVQLNDPGDKVFMNIPNPFGDYQPDYQLINGSDLLLSEALNSDDTDTANYRVQFSITPSGQSQYTLLQNGKTVSSGDYDPKAGVQWGTLNLTFTGEISNGDEIDLTRREVFHVFDTFKRGIDLAGSSIFDTSSTAELQQVTREFTAAFLYLNRVRAGIGMRLNVMDNQENMHKDFQLVLNKSLGSMEDLDYPSAAIKLNEDLLALKASQQAFAKVKDLTLFNFI